MRQEYLDLICDEPYIIGHELGFEDLTELHNTWIQSMMFSEQDETILAHRGSFKTTCLTLAIAFLMVIRPNNNIIFIRKTDDDVKEVVNQVGKILKSNLMKYIVYQLYGLQLELIEDTSFRITTNLISSTKGASQLLGLGIKASMTGKHADLVITDDIVNLKDRISKPERELIKTSYMELQNIKNRGGRILNTGTPWHKEDAISIMPNVQMYDCYSTGLIAREVLEQIRNTMTPSLFAANYELKHIADVDSLFSNPQFTDNTALIHNGICHIDASYGGGDGTAFTIIKDRGDKLIVFGKRFNKHVDDCLSEILAYREMFQAGSITCEDNGDKGYLKKELRNMNIVTHGYHESMNKFVKISTYLKKYWPNILFVQETDPEYINEILDYTENAAHDDSPDSLASLIRKLKGKGTWVY